MRFLLLLLISIIVFPLQVESYEISLMEVNKLCKNIKDNTEEIKLTTKYQKIENDSYNKKIGNSLLPLYECYQSGLIAEQDAGVKSKIFYTVYSEELRDFLKQFAQNDSVHIKDEKYFRIQISFESIVEVLKRKDVIKIEKL